MWWCVGLVCSWSGAWTAVPLPAGKELDELKLKLDGAASSHGVAKPDIDKMLELEKQYARAIDDRAALEAEVAELKAKLSHRQVKVCHMHPPAQANQAPSGQPQDI